MIKHAASGQFAFPYILMDAYRTTLSLVQRKIENRRLSGSPLEKTFSHRHAHFVAIGLRRPEATGRYTIDSKKRY